MYNLAKSTHLITSSIYKLTKSKQITLKTDPTINLNWLDIRFLDNWSNWPVWARFYKIVGKNLNSSALNFHLDEPL